jgi:toxin ParE1/3/4
MGAIHWRPQAINDLIRIARHVATRSPINAKKVYDQVQAKAAALATFPNMGRAGRRKGTRELVVHSHYIVVYRVTGQAVEIIRVKHTSRQPN